MIDGIPEEIGELLLNGTLSQRKYICGEEFAYFVFYYFFDFFAYDPAIFHWDFFEDGNRLIAGTIDETAWIAFRESAKTTIAKMFVVWCICYKHKKYIAWDSYDGSNAESALFDVTVILQTNSRILNDFGRLFRKRKRHKTKDELEDDAPEMKSTKNFVTTNGIKVRALTTQKSARGYLSGKSRPDMFIFDDIENEITKRSFLITEKIIEHVGVIRGGLGPTGSVLYLGNYITEEGVVAHVMDGLKDLAGKCVRNIPVIDKLTKEPAWPAKYTLTNVQALAYNLNRPREHWKISLEKKKADLNMEGKKVFETEMMNDPGQSGDYYFDRERIRQLLEKVRDPIKNVAGWKTWGKFDAKHRYAGGADTATGIGGDSSTDAIIDLSRTPNLLVGMFADNDIAIGSFGYSIKRHGEEFGECFYTVEKNGVGYATLAVLLEVGYTNLYVAEVKNKTSGKMQKEYGWNSTIGAKGDVLDQFKGAVEDGELEILDIDTLTEMYHMTKQHARMVNKTKGMTRHFDRVIAAALAWEGRKWATLSLGANKDLYKAPKRDAYEI